MAKAASPRDTFVKVIMSQDEVEMVRLAAAIEGKCSMSEYCRAMILANAERATAPFRKVMVKPPSKRESAK